MTQLATVALLVVLLVALYDWRRGLLLAIAVGFLQDPVRKLLPGEPVIAVIAVAVVFVTALAGLYLRGEKLHVEPLLRLYPRLRLPVALFFALVLLQTAVTVVRSRSAVLAGLGLLAYFGPLVALGLGQQFCRDYRDLRRWLGLYLLLAVAVGASVLLQFAGYRPAVFGSIGAELVYGVGVAVRTLCGLMRSSEIAAWHLGAGTCLVLTLVVSARSLTGRIAGTVVVGGLVVGIMLTGRRKMLAELVLFALLFGVLVTQYRRGGSRLLQGVAGGALSLVLGVQLFTSPDQFDRLGPYLVRSLSVLADSTERLGAMTIGQFQWVLAQNGPWGAGAGTGAQGSQYFGGGSAIVGYAAEGGLGRVLAELGVPGLVVVVWLTAAFARTLVDLARWARRLPPEQALPLYGLIAFLPANAAVFLTAHQVYGDPFVLLTLGWMAGALLAHPRLAAREARLEGERAERLARADARRRRGWRAA